MPFSIDKSNWNAVKRDLQYLDFSPNTEVSPEEFITSIVKELEDNYHYTYYLEDDREFYTGDMTKKDCLEDYIRTAKAAIPLKAKMDAIVKEIEALAAEASREGLEIRDFTSPSVVDTMGWQSSAMT